MDQAYATAVILLILVVGINALSSFIARKLTKRKRKGKEMSKLSIKNLDLY